MVRWAVLAAFAASLLPSAGGSAAAPAPVLGRDWKTRTIAAYDPLTLERVPGPSVPAAFFTGPWAWDGAHARLALTRDDWPQLRLVDAQRMRILGDVKLARPGTAGGVDAVTWVAPDRILVLVRGASSGVSFVLVDAAKRTVLRTVSLRGARFDAERIDTGLAVLLGPQSGLGPARVAVAGKDGTVRVAGLPGVTVGTRRLDHGGDPHVRLVVPGFAADPDGSIAVAVTAGGKALAVDTRTLAVSPHQLAERTLQRAAKSIEGPQRYAEWVGGGLLAVSGGDWSLGKGGIMTMRAAGVSIVDTRTWTRRTLDAAASSFSFAPGVVLAFGGSWSGSSSTYVGIHVYGVDGVPRWSLYDGQDAYAPVWGGFAYVQRHVGTNRPLLVDVVDPADGTILASRGWPKGQATPTLYAGAAGGF